MKSNWQIKTFEDCLDHITYTNKIQKNEFLPRGKYPIVSQEEDFINGYWNNEQDIFKVLKPVVVFGDHTKVLKFVDFDFVLGADGVKILQPKDFLTTRFFYYQLQGVNLDSLGYARHYKLLKSLQITYPPLREQKRIVGILDEAFESIAKAKANAEKNLQNARELFQSHLQFIFTKKGEDWPIKTISDISTHSLGKMLDRTKNKGTPRRYLRNTNVRWFDFDLSDLHEMKFLPAELEKYTVDKGDVLICEGGYPGRAAIWNENYPIHFQKALHRVRFHQSGHNKWFLYYIFLQDNNVGLRNYFTGTGIQHFTGDALHRFKIPIPPSKEISQYLIGFEKIALETQRLEAVYQQKITALDELKKSLLDQAFSGRL